MNKAREKFIEILESYTTHDNKILGPDIPGIASRLLTAIKENKIPGVGVCEGCLEGLSREGKATAELEQLRLVIKLIKIGGTQSIIPLTDAVRDYDALMKRERSKVDERREGIS